MESEFRKKLLEERTALVSSSRLLSGTLLRVTNFSVASLASSVRLVLHRCYRVLMRQPDAVS
jgi:hypothetical protein